MGGKRSPGYSKNKGSTYEREIVKQLKELTGNEHICTARSESKHLDNAKIDISDPDNILPCYFQLKKTQNVPAIKNINNDVGLKDKPLCILWNVQEKREINCVSVGEYAIIPWQFLKELMVSKMK